MASLLVGEPGGADVELGFEPWTSDHRAVLSTLEMTPVALPTTLSLTRRLLTEGQGLDAYTNAPGHDRVEIEIVREGGSAAEAVDTVTEPARGEVALGTG